MKQYLISAALVGILTAGACAAQDAQQPQQSSSSGNGTTSANNDSMQQCMARQKATNSGLTQLQMQTTCKNEIKAGKTHKEGNDLATGTQAGDVPKQ